MAVCRMSEDEVALRVIWKLRENMESFGWRNPALRAICTLGPLLSECYLSIV